MGSRYAGWSVCAPAAVAALLLLPGGQAEGAAPGRSPASGDSVRYVARVVDYDLSENLISLSGEAKIQYHGMELAAERIAYDIDQATVLAEGVLDTVKGEPRWVGTPVFRDADTQFDGVRMSYNLQTRKGTVFGGKTEFEKGFYFGEQIKRASQEVLYVGHGTYTTCENQEPHYYFASSRMKILLDDKIIARPIRMYVSGVPVAWLPFYVFPIKKGRHSGMLVPRYGSNSTDGRYLGHVGYYLAPSDYWDATLQGRIREDTGWLVQSDLRYAKRYALRGAAGASFEQRYSAATRSERWAASFRHDQTVGPELSLRGTGDFVSDKDFWSDNSDRPQDRMNRTLRSFLSLDKRWRVSGNSFNLAVSQDENLDTGSKTQKLPHISFRKARKPIWAPPKTDKAATTAGDALAKRWYQSIYYALGSNLDHLNRDYPTGKKRELSAGGDLDISSSQKIRGWLALSPSLRADERWKGEKAQDATTQYSRTDALSVSLSTGTTFYGLFRPQIGRLRAIRHVASPDISFTYGTSTSHTGGKYGFGGDSQSPTIRKALALKWNNTLQIKTVRGEKERKADLANLDFSTSYDFQEALHKLSDPAASLRISPSRALNVSVRTTHTLYDRADKLSLRAARLRSLSVNSTLNLAGRGGRTGGAVTSVPEFGSGLGELLGSMGTGLSSPLTMPNAEREFETPGRGWSLRLSYRYTLTKGSSYSSKTQWIQGNAGFSPTQNWRVDYALNYDLSPSVARSVTSQEFSIYRDLHCWEAKVRWTPSGPRRGYYFLMNIKELPDIKIERRKGVGGGWY